MYNYIDDFVLSTKLFYYNTIAQNSNIYKGRNFYYKKVSFSISKQISKHLIPQIELYYQDELNYIYNGVFLSDKKFSSSGIGIVGVILMSNDNELHLGYFENNFDKSYSNKLVKQWHKDDTF